MSALDRDKAREVLRHPYGPEDNWDWDLDRLEECVVEPEVVELTVEVEEFSESDMRLARIAALCDEVQPGGQQVVSLVALRAVLDGGA